MATPTSSARSQRLLGECRVVDSVIDALTANATISSVTSTNTHIVVAAGGFEGGTNSSFVFKVKDSGAGSVTEADVAVLGNALGYVLSQGSTAHFSPDNSRLTHFRLRLHPRDVLGNVERRRKRTPSPSTWVSSTRRCSAGCSLGSRQWISPML